LSFVTDQLYPGEIITYQVRSGFLAYIGATIYLLGIMAPGKLLRAASTELALTNKRVIGRTGAYHKKKIVLDHKDIQTVTVRHGIFGRLMNSGNVSIGGKDGSRITFYGVPYPLEVQQLLQEANEMAVLGRKLSQAVLDE